MTTSRVIVGDCRGVLRKWKWVRSEGGWETARGFVALRVERQQGTQKWFASASLPERDSWAHIGECSSKSDACAKAEQAVPGLLRQSYAIIVAELKLHGVEPPDVDEQLPLETQ